MRVFHDFYPGRSGDGMTVDSEGNLYVAAGLNRLRGTSETLDTMSPACTSSRPRASCWSTSRSTRTRSPTSPSAATTCRTLYITAGKTLFRIRTDITGTRR